MRKSSPILALILLLAGCESTVEIQQEQDLWNALEIRNYTYVYTVSCFCGFTGPNPALITVQNGIVTSVAPAEGAAPVPVTGPVAVWPTIDSLFAIAARAQALKPAVFNIQYDVTYHYPRVIQVDPVERAVDDEITYHADHFTPSASQ